MNKLGFSLIELIIGMAISSGVAIIIFISYYQTQKSSVTLDKIFALDSKITIFQNQFEKDITSIFAPIISEQQKEEKKETKEKITKIFFSDNQGNNLKELSFINTNPLQIYGESKPTIVRVTYILKEEKNLKDSYALYRTESNNLDYGSQKKNLQYEVVNGIKEFKIEYIVPEKREQKTDLEKKEKETKEAKEKKPKKFKRFNQWKFSDSKKKETEFLIPQYVNVKISFWQDENRFQDFELKYYIFGFESQFIKQKVEKPKVEEKMKSLASTVEQLKKGLPEKPQGPQQQQVKR